MAGIPNVWELKAAMAAGKEISMEEKHYVVQFRRYPHSNVWGTVSGPYATIEEAEAARQKMPCPSSYRVAESYVQIRYKAVKV